MIMRNLIVISAIIMTIVCSFAVYADNAFSYVEEGQNLPRMTLLRHQGEATSYLGDGDTISVFAFVKAGHERSNELLDRLSGLSASYDHRPVQWTLIISNRTPADSLPAIAARFPAATILIDQDDRFYGAVGVPLVPVVGIADSSAQLLAYLPYRKVNYTRIIEARLKLALGDINADELDAMMASSGRVLDSDDAKSSRHLKIAGMLLKSGKAEKSRLQIEDALALSPDSFKAYRLLADVLDALSEPDAAASARNHADSLQTATAPPVQ